MSPARFHLDHNATTPVDPRVLERFVAVEHATPGNPSSLHAAGRTARAVLEDARCEVAAALGTDPDAVVFVSGGTEANNMAILGAGDPARPVLVSPADHSSVLAPAERRGIRRLSIDAEGRTTFPADPEELAGAGLVVVSHAQSEIGTLQDVGAARRCADAAGVPLHVDAAQTLGRVDLGPAIAAADSVALSVHKCGGLRGASVLVAHPAVLRPLLVGGGQERGLRAGTPSPSLAAATARAIALAVEERSDRAARTAAARDAFVARVTATLPEARVLTPADALPNTALLRFVGVDGRLLLPALDVAGVEASQGSACSAGSPEPPAVLTGIGLDERATRQCVRFSFGFRDNPDDAKAAADAVRGAVARLLGIRTAGGKDT